MSIVHHTAARLLFERPRMGNAFARPRAADVAALSAGGVCPAGNQLQTGVGFSRGDPAP